MVFFILILLKNYLFFQTDIQDRYAVCKNPGQSSQRRPLCAGLPDQISSGISSSSSIKAFVSSSPKYFGKIRSRNREIRKAVATGVKRTGHQFSIVYIIISTVSITTITVLGRCLNVIITALCTKGPIRNSNRPIRGNI